MRVSTIHFALATAGSFQAATKNAMAQANKAIAAAEKDAK